MKKIILTASILTLSTFVFAENSWNPIKLSGQCVGRGTNMTTPFVGMDPDASYGVFMRNDGADGMIERPFSVIGQNGNIRIHTPDTFFTFSAPEIKTGAKTYFSLTSRLGYESQETDTFDCEVEFL